MLCPFCLFTFSPFSFLRLFACLGKVAFLASPLPPPPPHPLLYLLSCRHLYQQSSNLIRRKFFIGFIKNVKNKNIIVII
ncbi:hypothetical protein V6Z11_D10G191300 [Gossypium hirsutum]